MELIGNLAGMDSQISSPLSNNGSVETFLTGPTVQGQVGIGIPVVIVGQYAHQSGNTFEYHVLPSHEVESFEGHLPLIEHLNKLGSEAWELVGTHKDGHLLFKRQVASSSGLVGTE